MSTTSHRFDFLDQPADRAVTDEEAMQLAAMDDLEFLMAEAAARRDRAFGDAISYSRKVFIPLTQLCRDVCHYCTFAKRPRQSPAAYLMPDEVVAIAKAGERAGCTEALFTLGDKPELRYGAARDQLARLGFATTLDYLAAMAKLVLAETTLLPHLNPGIMTRQDLEALRPCSASMGIMLESSSNRLSQPGGPHFGSPDKLPAARLRVIEEAGKLAIPFTSGLLIGIGETRRERIEALLALRAAHRSHGHLQEIIIQNFRAKPNTRMAAAPEPSFDDHLWTIAVARIILGSEINLQAPPNLSGGKLDRLIAAGINDWGGVSPVTIDHVNPEAPWPQLEDLRAQTAVAGKILVERLPAYPDYVRAGHKWFDAALLPRILDGSDSTGLARAGRWVPGSIEPVDLAPKPSPAAGILTSARRRLHQSIDKGVKGVTMTSADIVALFEARGDDVDGVCRAADDLRRRTNGDRVSYVVTRNINYTNICYFRCQFCAFSKGKMSENLRGRPYDLGHEEIQRRVREAWERGATEVCLQGGIHPAYTGATYLAILKAVKEAVPDIHVHAFSPLEVWQGAATSGSSIRDFLMELKANGLGSLPGTAAEILDDEVRQVICPDKITTDKWLTVVGTAHRLGLKSTATIMFGHVERPVHWARHLIRLRDLQLETGGITEFVPLPFVPMQTPIYLKGRARRGPTFRETVLMHAVARLALNPAITNIQVSWVKMGIEGARLALQAGVNDLGGTLMNESISRAAGASHGQEMTPEEFERIAVSVGRSTWQRTTLYARAHDERKRAAHRAAPLTEIAFAAS